jgi:hydrogenase expression/formation protein HypC
MCLAVPGKIIDAPRAGGDADVENVATVDFQGTRAEVSLVLTPQARPGDWVLVHAGFALQMLDEAQALETWRYLEQVCELNEAGAGEGAVTPTSKTTCDKG